MFDMNQSVRNSPFGGPTVGYGDVAPAANGIRLIAAPEIGAGILLLLFGFNKIFSFARRRDRFAPQPVQRRRRHTLDR